MALKEKYIYVAAISGTFPVEDIAHDSGLVSAEYGCPKGSPNTNN
jgi:hypothetical protein